MVLERLEIVLDEPSRAYFSGQMLKGRVRLTTDKSIQIKCKDFCHFRNSMNFYKTLNGNYTIFSNFKFFW